MSWRDDLRPASFRGVPFEVERHETPAGRRQVVEVYPERDTIGTQDLGRNVGQPIQFDAYIVDEDYIPARNRLLDALDKYEPGELVHPYYGRLWVVAGECSYSESTREGGMVRFALVFYQRAEVERSVERIVSPAAASASAQTAQTAASSAYTDAYTDIAAVSSLVLAAFNAQAADDRIGAFVAAGMALSDAEDAATLSTWATTLGTTITTLDAALTVAARATSLVIGVTSAKVATAWAAHSRLLRLVGVRRAVEIAVATTYTAADDAERDEDRIVDAIAALEAESGVPFDVLGALRDLRTTLVAALSDRVTTLPRLTTHTAAEPIPAVVLAMQLYGDPDRAEEIVKRNVGVAPNPGFLAGPLEVLSS